MEEFEVHELVCNHIYRIHGATSLKFADPRLLKWLSWFRTEINLPVYINNYGFPGGGGFSQRGYRCNLCSLVKDKTDAGQLYLSAHTRFQAVDFNVEGMLDEEIRQWIERHKSQMPGYIRVEKNTVGWVHVDVANDTYQKIIYFEG